jgi:hypothetical protein
MRATREVSDRRFVKDPPASRPCTDELRYIDKVGTGFTRKSSIEIRRKLEAITTAKSPLTKR